MSEQDYKCQARYCHYWNERFEGNCQNREDLMIKCHELQESQIDKAVKAERERIAGKVEVFQWGEQINPEFMQSVISYIREGK